MWPEGVYKYCSLASGDDNEAAVGGVGGESSAMRAVGDEAGWPHMQEQTAAQCALLRHGILTNLRSCTCTADS
jgi:hypothetical protein